ncbi:MAG: hypothetical protein IPM47_07915 [Sphingobacteriales bacterium]|nr:MAG: hypothetical protein IPM47_07915 [Sphingobacteriales bacterium]
MILKLACEQCGAPVAAVNINIEKAIAKCTQCGCVFSFEKHLPSAEPVKERTEIDMPDGIDVLHLASELTLYIKWSSAFNKFLLLFTAIWNSVVMLFVVVAILTGQWIILLFISIHLSVAIGLTYYLIALRFNTTEISVTKQRVTIRHKPIWVPFFKNREVNALDIKQLYTAQYVAGRVNQQPQYAYEVKLITKSDQSIRILHGLKRPVQAQYIEQEIEKYLQIKNVRVEGELS